MLNEPDLNACNLKDEHVLFTAVRTGSLSFVQKLTSAGVDPSIVNQAGQKAVDLAKKRSEKKIYEFLLQYSEENENQILVRKSKEQKDKGSD